MSVDRKVRRTRLKLLMIAEVELSWGKSSITFSDGINEVVVPIEEPYMMRYVREKLDEIEVGWKRQLDLLKDKQ